MSGQDLNLGHASDGNVRVTTGAAFFELCPRFHLTSHWQLGPVAHLFVGRDVSFSESTVPADYLGSSLAAGARVDYEIAGIWVGKLRVGAQLLTDLTIANRQLLWAQADLQFGIPLGLPFGKVSTSSTPVASAPAPAVEAPSVAILNERIRIRLPDGALHFATAQTGVFRSSERMLRPLTEALVRNQADWKNLILEGHADSRGDRDANVELGLERAEAVRSEMTRFGLPATRMHIASRGSAAPVLTESNQTAWTINRRVEIWLENVSDLNRVAADLEAALNEGARNP